MKFFFSKVCPILFIICCAMALSFVMHFIHLRRYSPTHPENIRLNAVLIGDMHTDGDIFRDRNNVLRRALGAISCSKKPIDALVIAGDITNAGAEVEYRNLNRMLAFLDKSKQILPQMGNHDSGGTSEDKSFENECILFRQFCDKHGVETKENYYSATVNDYCFIALGTEKMQLNDAYISDSQLMWLDATLTQAQDNGKIAFVICHQPLNETNGVADIWSEGGLGEQSSQVKQIIQKHTDSGMTILFISGHLHAPISASSFETVSNGFYCINLPSVQFTNDGGWGVLMEVYDDIVILRARNFISNKDDTSFKIDLVAIGD